MSLGGGVARGERPPHALEMTTMITKLLTPKVPAEATS